ncbi:radical SAM protein [Patescibacteria group bacterium]|nr:radical SAM protein [Patescibacteria group bacterium]
MQGIPLIWNITKACPWNCSFCCINAYYLPSFESLETELEKIKRKGVELSLEDKLKVVDNLDLESFDIDISGGEPLLFRENVEVIRRLSKKFGRDNISITTTGRGLALVDKNALKDIIREVGFTYDSPYEPNSLRPKGYNSSNLEQIKQVVQIGGMRTMAQIPLTKLNVDEEIIKDIYRNLTDAGVERLHLMKFFPVGRGAHRLDLSLTNQEYQTAIDIYQKLESFEGPRVYVQNALGDSDKNSSHLNITFRGLLLSDPWAYDPHGEPLEESILGDLRYQKFSGIAKL